MNHDGPDQFRPVDRVILHDRADVAILIVSPQHAFPDKFAGDTSIYTWGVPVSAFGYPEDAGVNGLQPTPRYFRGNIQRLFQHSSHLGFDYEAAELSFGAPAGLSGGVVTPDSDYAMAMGLVAENRTSSTYLSTLYERVTETTSLREIVHSTINYSVVVRLDPLSEWLDRHLPYSATDL